MDVLVNKSDLRAGELESGAIAQAYALARLAGVEQDEETWCEGILALQDSAFERKAGVIAIRNLEDYIVALIFYEVGNKPEVGRVLHLRDLILPIMFRNSFVDCFRQIVDRMAKELECWTIFVPEEVMTTLDTLGPPQGFHADDGGMFRYLPAAN